MKDNFQQQASREVLVAREFLKAACGQASEGDAHQSPLAGRFDFLAKYQAQPSMDSSLSLLSKQWVPVGTRPMHSVDGTVKSEKPLLHNLFLPQNTGKDSNTSAEAFSLARGQAGPRLPQHVQAFEGEDAARRGRKRERPSTEVTVDGRWTLKQKLAGLTQDIELLTQEVALVRGDADASCAAPRLTLEEKAGIADKHAKKQVDAQKRGVSVMLRDIMAHKFANPFLKPVDTKLYPDYPLKIREPLDFGTVKARLDAGSYTSNMDAFARDMTHIFNNAFLYNAPGSTVHGWAVTLKEKFEERLKNLNNRLVAMEGEQRKEEEELLDIAKRRLQDRAWEVLAVERQRFEPLISGIESRIKELKAESAAGCSFVSQAEKHALMEALGELKTEDFEQAMQIILHRHPGLLQANAEVLNIDFDPLDALTLRQLAAFCRFCLKGTNPEFSNGWPGLLFGTGARGISASEGRLPAAAPEESQGWNAKKPKIAEDPAKPPAKDQVQPVSGVAVLHTGQGAELQPAESSGALPDRQVPDKSPALKALSVQTREVGERSWSVLDTEAVTGLKAGLKAAAAHKKDQ